MALRDGVKHQPDPTNVINKFRVIQRMVQGRIDLVGQQ